MEEGGGGNLLKLLVLLGRYSKSRLRYGTAAEYVTFFDTLWTGFGSG